jgi:thiol:disulfide interchange protein/DsbC/DsbD-like thiol-disulfide interchange protein
MRGRRGTVRRAGSRDWALLAILLLLPGRAIAASNGASRNVKVALVSEVASIQPGLPFRLGVRLEMAEHWHTYWKHPADAGLPTRLKWKLPEGFAAGEIEWPVPLRLSAPPLLSYGYEHDVLLPVEIEPPASLVPGPVTLAAKVDWLECRELCIPGKADLDLTLPVQAGAPAPSPEAPLFAEARRQLPGPATGWRLAAEAGPRAISLTVAGPPGLVPAGAFLFVDEALVTEYAAPQGFERRGDGYRLTLQPAANAPGRPARLTGVLVTEGGDGPRAIQVDVPVVAGDPAPAEVPVAPPPKPATAPEGPSSLFVALGFAFLGGLILNLMPCVLPVLSLKVLSFVRQSGGHPQHAWRHGVVFAAGVVLSFWALAGALLAFRAGGEQIGWGFQLQSPPFLVVLAGLFLLLGLNLFGVFEVGESLTAAGNLVTGQTGLHASFWNGVLATIVATPCSAPFMGSALGFGLSRPAPVALAVFTALGLGMALPYVLLSTNPRLLRFVPKPGGWMEGFKQLMGFVLLATVAALVWLFGQQTGVDAMGVLLAALVITALGAWVYGRGTAPGRSPRSRALATVAAIGLMGVGLAIGLSRASAVPPIQGRGSSTSSGGLAFEEYSPARVAELRAQGRPLFIDFTAAWCLSCQVNERVALQSESVVDRFHREGIVALRADWTRRDDRITQALVSFGRQGVPVYVLYGRDTTAAPRLLPEVLTPGVVLAAIDETLGRPATADARPPR